MVFKGEFKFIHEEMMGYLSFFWNASFWYSFLKLWINFEFEFKNVERWIDRDGNYFERVMNFFVSSSFLMFGLVGFKMFFFVL